MSKTVRILSVLLILGISLSILLAPSASSASIVDGLVAYYPFNGNARDYSGNGNHGKVLGATPSEDRFGNPDNAYCFDGIDDYIEIPDSESLDIAKDISITGWIRVNQYTDEWLGIVNKADSDNYDTFEICIHRTKLIHFPLKFQTSGRICYNSSPVINEGEWHFFAVTYNGPTVNIYVDDSLNITHPSTNEPLETNNHPLTIGAEKEIYDGPHHFNGLIDDIRIYNRALTQTEIATLFRQGPTNWPIFQNDAQHTGRSPFTGPQAKTVRWTFYIGENSTSSPVIAKNGTIYTGSADWKLYALNPDGTLQWTFPTGGAIHSSPAIGEDGTIYVGSRDNKIYAVTPNGILKWAYETAGDVNSSPTIGHDGIIYVCSCDGNLYALNMDGTLKWRYSTSWSLSVTPAIGPDGIIYFGIPVGKMVALNPDGTEKWTSERHSVNGFWATPTVSPDGAVVYCGAEDGFFAINANDGSLKWISPFTYGGVQSSAAIGKDGVVYVGTQYGYLWALNSGDGSIKWQLYPTLSAWSSPAIGSDDTIYFATDYGQIFAVNPDSTIKWNYQGHYSTDGHFRSSPSIGSDGTLYIVSTNGKLYAFNTPVCKGDFDKDGDVDGTDLAAFAADFGSTNCPVCPQ